MRHDATGKEEAGIPIGNKAVDDLGYEKLHDALAIHHQGAEPREEILTFALFMECLERDRRKRTSPVTPRAPGLR